MSTPVFSFGEYTLRPVTEDDRALVAAWIEQDPDHRGTTPPEFFLRTEPGSEPFVLEDQAGVVFFLRLTKVMRLDIQFGPATLPEDRTRTRDAMIEGVAWLADTLGRMNGCRELIFESRNPMLIRTCEKRLGFLRSSGEMVRPIAPILVTGTGGITPIQPTRKDA